MAGLSSGSLVSDAEIEAALAQAEAAVESIPSLEDGSGETIVPIPVQALPQLPVRKPAEPSAGPAAIDVPILPAVATAQAPAVPDAKAEVRAGVAPAVREQPSILYRALDTVLWTLNRPFEWMSPEVRGVTGLLALVTIIMSLFALLLLPRLFPATDLMAQFRH